MSERCNPCESNNGSFLEPKASVFPAQKPSTIKRTMVASRVKIAKTINNEVCIDCIQEPDVVNCPQGTTQKLVPSGASYCEEINGVKTGFSISTYIDTNPCSSTFNQTFPIKQSSINCIPVTPIGITVSAVTCEGGYVNV